jgi:hypothetical protein
MDRMPRPARFALETLRDSFFDPIELDLLLLCEGAGGLLGAEFGARGVG